MSMKSTLWVGAFAIALGGCATDSGYYRSANDDGPRGYSQAQRCDQCGTVADINRVGYGDRRTSGGGAVVGALVGGAIGNQFGKGDGRKAATVAGAVIGGVAGNNIERNRNGEEVFEISVRMDDGRYVTFEQYQLNGIREGSRVIVDNNGVANLDGGDW